MYKYKSFFQNLRLSDAEDTNLKERKKNKVVGFC